MPTTRKILCMTYRLGSTNPSVNEEACQGDCYAYDDVLRIQNTGWTAAEVRTAMTHLLAIHAKICGNSNYRLGIDLDESGPAHLFIGSFYHFGALEIVTGDSILEAIEDLATVTKSYFDSEQYALDKAADPGLGRGACAHGDETALKSWMAKVGGFDTDTIA